MFSEIDMTKMLGCLIDNRFAMLGERVFFSTNGRYSYGYQLCFTSHRLVPLLV